MDGYKILEKLIKLEDEFDLMKKYYADDEATRTDIQDSRVEILREMVSLQKVLLGKTDKPYVRPQKSKETTQKKYTDS